MEAKTLLLIITTLIPIKTVLLIRTYHLFIRTQTKKCQMFITIFSNNKKLLMTEKSSLEITVLMQVFLNKEKIC